MITVTLYSRKDCHLCEIAKADLDDLRQVHPHELVVIDVDSSIELKRAYGFEVPVVEAGPYKLRAPFDRAELAITLAAAIDRRTQLHGLQGNYLVEQENASRTWSKADGFTYWLSKHYLAIFNLLVIVYLGLPVLAPVLMKIGWTSPAGLIYRGYGIVCHQLAYRSFFLFGEQAAYPRSAADVKGMQTYQDATGLSEESTAQGLYAARQFVGNEQVGYKMALCERDISIYGAILGFGLVFGLVGRRIPALPWYAWVVIGLVPIGIDGFSQLLSQPPFGFISYRESTPVLRSLTGALFGLSTAWFGYPMVEETMVETRRIMASKILRIRNMPANQPKPGE